MILFVLPTYEYLADEMRANNALDLGRFIAGRYPNGELNITVASSVANQKCVILGSIAPPDEQLLITLLLAHTLKKEAASKVIALLPYLAYTRANKPKPALSLTTEWVGKLFDISGIDEVISVDIHNGFTEVVFPVPLVSISAASIFAEQIKRMKLNNITLVAPDESGIGRLEKIQKLLGVEVSFAHFKKRRTETGIEHTAFEGSVTETAFVLDDILDTGSTLILACKELQKAGVRHIVVMVTHGLFTGKKWQALWDYGVTDIYCTNSIPIPVSDSHIKVLSTLPLFNRLFSQ
ncbi:MAG TPA: ribose-phosphate diphosphokinase [Patescibacteria group bacterium]|nr:ribose-phosphate diphosphokinase [Patescibacteria group bacterium]